MTWDLAQVRAQFPILARQIDGQPLVYLDNAATTQKPQVVIDALVHYYSHYNANVHRGAHRLADEATAAFEAARQSLARYLGSPSAEQVIFTRGTTDAINLLAHGLGQSLQVGDEILITQMEHHANLVPWQQLCLAKGATLKVAPINAMGELDVDAWSALLSERTAIVAFTHVSNALGTINPVAKLCAQARAQGAVSVVDGAQGAAHGPLNLTELGCDFYVFSGHKLYGPTGVGVLWGRQAPLERLPVYQTGGEMIASVSFEHTEFNVLPYRLEAGTPNIADVIGLGAAIDWLLALDWQAVAAHEQDLIQYATQRAAEVPGLRILGQAADKISVLSFVLAQGHPADVGFLLDRQGIAIRTGNHCAEPLMSILGVPGTARASFALYNSRAEVDAFINALHKANEMLA